MDKATVEQLRQGDGFALATENGIQWAESNRGTVIVWGAVLVVLVLLLLGGFGFYRHRVNEAETALGAALAIYQTPIPTAGQPTPPGMTTYPDAKTRAAAANSAFASAADQFGMTEPGRNALFFEGITSIEMGQTASGEATLKKVASGWDSDTAALAKQALAQLYTQEGRTAEAISLYEELGKGSAITVSPFEAKLELAALYAAQGKTADANKLYAEIKDQDKDKRGQPGPAAEIASSKLTPQS